MVGARMVYQPSAEDPRLFTETGVSIQAVTQKSPKRETYDGFHQVQPHVNKTNLIQKYLQEILPNRTRAQKQNQPTYATLVGVRRVPKSFN